MPNKWCLNSGFDGYKLYHKIIGNDFVCAVQNSEQHTKWWFPLLGVASFEQINGERNNYPRTFRMCIHINLESLEDYTHKGCSLSDSSHDDRWRRWKRTKYEIKLTHAENKAPNNLGADFTQLSVSINRISVRQKKEEERKSIILLTICACNLSLFLMRLPRIYNVLWSVCLNGLHQ